MLQQSEGTRTEAITIPSDGDDETDDDYDDGYATADDYGDDDDVFDANVDGNVDDTLTVLDDEEDGFDDEEDGFDDEEDGFDDEEDVQRYHDEEDAADAPPPRSRFRGRRCRDAASRRFRGGHDFVFG
ncbi:unnamed protein product [Bathycoccus prasinos]